MGVFFERRFQPLSVGGFFSNQRESISRCPKSPFPSKPQNRQEARTSPLSLNPVRSSIVQDLRLLPTLLLSISRSPSIFLFLSVFLADKCVFQVMSINKSMSSNKKLLSLIQLVKLFVSFIQKCYPSKIFGPRWGFNTPRTPCKAPPFTAGYAPDLSNSL